MANIRLYQFPTKVTPVAADILYGGDSAAAFDEVQFTIAELIGVYPNLLSIGGLTLGANTYPWVDGSSVFTAGSVTPTPTGSVLAAWDANRNMSANNFIFGYATTATAAATTTLTVASAYNQFFTGSTTQTVVMPVVSTLKLGQQFYIVNLSSGNVTVESSGANSIQVMVANSTLLLTCVAITGTTAASWNAEYAFNGADPSNPTFASITFSPTTGGIVGTTTNDNAGAGYVGEFVSSQVLFASAVSFTTATFRDITSISLTAGDWDVWGNVTFAYSATTSIIAAWVSSTSASIPDASLYTSFTPGGVGSISSAGICVPSLRFSLSGTTTIYLSAAPGTFSGTGTGCGGIYARRVR